MATVPTDQANYAVNVTSFVTLRFVGTLASAVAVYVPQLALLALLLTSPTRVGSFEPLVVILAVSDILTFILGLVAVVQLWWIGWVENSLVKALPAGSYRPDPSVPGFIRWIMEARKSFSIDSTSKFVLTLSGFVVFVLGVNVYIGWLWYHP